MRIAPAGGYQRRLVGSSGPRRVTATDHVNFVVSAERKVDISERFDAFEKISIDVFYFSPPDGRKLDT